MFSREGEYVVGGEILLYISRNAFTRDWTLVDCYFWVRTHAEVYHSIRKQNNAFGNQNRGYGTGDKKKILLWQESSSVEWRQVVQKICRMEANRKEKRTRFAMISVWANLNARRNDDQWWLWWSQGMQLFAPMWSLSILTAHALWSYLILEYSFSVISCCIPPAFHHSFLMHFCKFASQKCITMISSHLCACTNILTPVSPSTPEQLKIACEAWWV